MINLLPIVDKREIMAGRTNRVLLRYIVFSLALLGVVLVAFIIMYVFLFNQKATAEQQIKNNQVKVNEASEQSKKKEIDEFTKNLATIKQILDKRVNYSSGVTRLANLMPSGVVLESLELSPTTTTTPQSLTVRTKSEAAAVAFKDALNNNSTYFSDAKFESITLGTTSTSTDNKDAASNAYPYAVSMTVTFKKELFQ